MKHLKKFNEGWWDRTDNPIKNRSLSFQDGDTVMTPDGTGTVIPNTSNDGNIWVKLDDKSKSNVLTGDENVYHPTEVTVA